MLTQILFGNYLTQTLTLYDSSGTDLAPRRTFARLVSRVNKYKCSFQQKREGPVHLPLGEEFWKEVSWPGAVLCRAEDRAAPRAIMPSVP